MKSIQMVDLKGQYEKIKPEVDLAIQQVIDNTAFIGGAAVSEFQSNLEKYLDVNHVIPCANGTDALQLALMSLELSSGDEVITTDFTFAATVEVIGLLGLKPVLIDINTDDYNMDIDALEKAIGPNTKAIIPVHLFGQTCDMESIMNIAEKHNLYVIEDTAQALGAHYTFSDGTVKKLGTIGHIGTTSFFPSKNLGAYGDGGAIFTNDQELATALRALGNHGMFERYYYAKIGINSRLDGIQAAILNCKLPHLDQYAKSRREAASFYNEALSEIPQIICPAFQKDIEHVDHVFHQYTMQVLDGHRDGLQAHLTELKIPNAIYYPKTLHEQEAYRDLLDDVSQIKNTIELSKTVLSLPMHTELDKEQLVFITNTIKTYFQKL